MQAEVGFFGGLRQSVCRAALTCFPRFLGETSTGQAEVVSCADASACLDHSTGYWSASVSLSLPVRAHQSPHRIKMGSESHISVSTVLSDHITFLFGRTCQILRFKFQWFRSLSHDAFNNPILHRTRSSSHSFNTLHVLEVSSS